MDIETLKELALSCTALNLNTAEIVRNESDKEIECPMCGEGYVDLEVDYCNIDSHAIGVQFYGIGNEFGAGEAYFRAASPKNILALIERIKLADHAIAERDFIIDEMHSEREQLLAQEPMPVATTLIKDDNGDDPGLVSFCMDDWVALSKLPHGTKLYTQAVPAQQVQSVEPNHDPKVLSVFDEHWRDIVCNSDGSFNEYAVKCELHDFRMAITEVPKVYDHITGGRISKPLTHAQYVIDAFEERLSDDIAEAIAELEPSQAVAVQKDE